LLENLNRRLSERASDTRGFTLIEMMIVIAVIAMIMGWVGTNIFRNYEKAKVDGTKIQMKQLGTILEDFNRECGFYPTTDQGLDALVHQPSGRECKNYDPKGYVPNGRVPKDAWGRDYLYTSDGSSFELKSLGKDGKEGGDDLDKDISSNDAE
jgi:general secretion pathway protein G